MPESSSPNRHSFLSQCSAAAQPATVRRAFLSAAVSAVGVALSACGAQVLPRAQSAPAPAPTPSPASSGGCEPMAREVFSRDHGVLERILLIYEDASSRLLNGLPFELEILARAATLFDRFIDKGHERLEEELLFPHLVNAKSQLNLVATLRQQHTRGGELTAEVLRLSAIAANSEPERTRLAQTLKGVAHMYRAHTAREETVLFPALQALLGKSAYAEQEARVAAGMLAQFGPHAFEDAVAHVTELEEALGIHELSGFTAV